MPESEPKLDRSKYYDVVVDEYGNERPEFSHMTIETDDGVYVLGDKCKECSGSLIPRIAKSDGEYHTEIYCPKCKER
jgi:hypothetical protein